MKPHFYRTTAVVLAIALSVSLAAGATPRKSDRERANRAIVRMIEKIQRIFGVQANDDLPTPPKPENPPSTTT